MWAFFGLKSKEVFLRPIFEVMYYGGFTWTEAYHLPLNFRRWYINEIVAEMKRTSGGGDDDDPKPMNKPFGNMNDGVTQTRGRQLNTPDARAWRGANRQHVPSRLIRLND